jgi:hypothetical protein
MRRIFKRGKNDYERKNWVNKQIEYLKKTIVIAELYISYVKDYIEEIKKAEKKGDIYMPSSSNRAGLKRLSLEFSKMTAVFRKPT